MKIDSTQNLEALQSDANMGDARYKLRLCVALAKQIVARTWDREGFPGYKSTDEFYKSHQQSMVELFGVTRRELSMGDVRCDILLYAFDRACGWEVTRCDGSLPTGYPPSRKCNSNNDFYSRADEVRRQHESEWIATYNAEEA